MKNNPKSLSKKNRQARQKARKLKVKVRNRKNKSNDRQRRNVSKPIRPGPTGSTLRNSLQIVSWNIECQNSSTIGCKFDDGEFAAFLGKHDIICLQETKGAVSLPNYRSHNQNRADSRSGGVAILYKNELSRGISRIKINSNPDIIAIKLHKNFFSTKEDMVLVNFYASPSNSSYSIGHPGCPYDLIGEELLKLSNIGNLLVCCDANARTQDLRDYIETDTFSKHLPIPDDIFSGPVHLPRNNCDSGTNSYTRPFLDMIIALRLKILNGRTLGDVLGCHTCVKKNGTSAIDYFLADPTVSKHIISLKVSDFTQYSDHRPLCLDISIPNQFKFERLNITFSDVPKPYMWKPESKKAMQQLMSHPLNDQLLDQMLSMPFENSVEGSEKMNNEVVSLFIKFGDQVLTKSKGLPNRFKHRWFDIECLLSKRKIETAAKNLSKHRFYPDLAARYYDDKKVYSKLLRNKKLLHNISLNQKIQDGQVLDWKAFKKAKSSTNPNKGPSQTLDTFDLYNFYSFFSKLYQPKQEHDAHVNLQEFIDNNRHNTADFPGMEILNRPIEIDEIKTAIKGLKNNKSAGEDLISNEILKSLNEKGTQVTLNLFNHCLQSGAYPWHESIITPLLKSGDRHDPDNYRAIAVSSCLGKTFSTILLNRMLDFRKENCPDTAAQLGFCKGAQTNDHILTLKTIIDKYRSKKPGKLLACFVDLRKAFDSVCRTALLYKLTKLGIRGNFFCVLENMYKNSVARIKLSGKMSEIFKILIGTEQGHPLSPELFKVFIHDLSEELDKVLNCPYLSATMISHLLWADDLVLLALDPKSLHELMKILERFCKTWGLQINQKKTKIMDFSTAKFKKSDLNISIDGQIIETTDQYCYLGINFHRSGSFNLATNELRKKALRASYGLKRGILKDVLTGKTLVMLFDTLIKPILLYGCSVWAPHLLWFRRLSINDSRTSRGTLEFIAGTDIEKFHLKYLKWCLGVHSKTTNTAVWGDFGRHPILFESVKLAFDYHDRLVTLAETDKTRLVVKAFEDQKLLNLGWYQSVTNLKNHYQAPQPNRDLTLYQRQGMSDSTNAMLNIRLEFQTTWSKCTLKMAKLDFYNTIKSKFQYEPYLDITEPYTRSSLARLRTSSHRLEVETGRYKKDKVAREERICKYCFAELKIRTIDDENHVLNVCPLYSSERMTCASRTHVIKTSAAADGMTVLDLDFLEPSNTAAATTIDSAGTAGTAGTHVSDIKLDTCLGLSEKLAKTCTNIRGQPLPSRRSFVIKMQLSIGRFLTKAFKKHEPFEDKRAQKTKKPKTKNQKKMPVNRQLTQSTS